MCTVLFGVTLFGLAVGGVLDGFKVKIRASSFKEFLKWHNAFQEKVNYLNIYHPKIWPAQETPHLHHRAHSGWYLITPTAAGAAALSPITWSFSHLCWNIPGSVGVKTSLLGPKPDGIVIIWGRNSTSHDREITGSTSIAVAPPRSAPSLFSYVLLNPL